MSNYLRSLWKDGESTIYDVFDRRLAPWEVEQIACVHDFLARAIMPGENFLIPMDRDSQMENVLTEDLSLQ